MSDLIKYNEELTFTTQGIQNFGATCYFATMLQCLLSCTSLFEVLLANKDTKEVKSNYLAMLLLTLYDTSKKSQPISEICFHITKYFITQVEKMRKLEGCFMGQQDIDEALVLFIDMLEDVPCVYQLFVHRHKHHYYCATCKKTILQLAQTNIMFEVQANLQSEQLDVSSNETLDLNYFLRRQKSYIDADHICDKCKTKGAKPKFITLTMVPEILPITIKKYDNKVYTYFPAYLEFNTNKTEKLRYMLVAQAEHSGNTLGGHYYGIVKRKEGWMLVNDQHYAPTLQAPTHDTYMVFYHYVGKISS